MSQLFKVIITDNLNREITNPQGLVTMAMSENVANQVASLLNNIYGATSTNFAKVVPADQPLNLSSQHDLVGTIMPYDEWATLTGSAALPKHVAEYWYTTTVLVKNQPAVKKSSPFEIDLTVLPLTLKEFERKFSNCNNVESAYKAYLERNSANHHYGDFTTLNEWYQDQIK